MQLSIVIVNYNVKYFVEQCLLSVLAASKNIATEIFVVDNHSSADIRCTQIYIVVDYTPVVAPTVSTSSPVVDIGGAYANVAGNITNTGGGSCTQRGICYNTTGSPTTGDSKVYDSGSYSTGAFSKTLTGLSISTTYHCKAYAINSAGTSYGSEVDFTTGATVHSSKLFTFKG